MIDAAIISTFSINVSKGNFVFVSCILYIAFVFFNLYLRCVVKDYTGNLT